MYLKTLSFATFFSFSALRYKFFLFLVFYLSSLWSVSLIEHLGSLGFESKNKLIALEALLQKSQIITEKQDLKGYFPDRTDDKELFNDAWRFLKDTQEKWVARSDGKERWEVKLNTLSEDDPSCYPYFETLGLTLEKAPKKIIYDAACILGSTFPVMQKRIQFLDQYIKTDRIKGSYIILLSGQREALEGVDLSGIELKVLADSLEKQKEQLDEMDLLKFALEPFEETFQSWKFIFVYTPKLERRRPTTETTLKQLIHELESNKMPIKTLLFVSTQPFVSYQEAYVKAAFKDTAIDVELIGPASSKKINQQKLLSALGGQIFVCMPTLLEKLCKDSNLRFYQQKQALSVFESSYVNNPILLESIAKLKKES